MVARKTVLFAGVVSHIISESLELSCGRTLLDTWGFKLLKTVA